VCCLSDLIPLDAFELIRRIFEVDICLLDYRIHYRPALQETNLIYSKSNKAQS